LKSADAKTSPHRKNRNDRERICAGMSQNSTNHTEISDQQLLTKAIHPRFNGSPCLAGGLPRELTVAVA